ncbi:MAG: hypothetical protein GC151_08575 [Betaproteobacteria bacterium]|nr:hypothetical protein [Betaproteobacteria bacterium]
MKLPTFRTILVFARANVVALLAWGLVTGGAAAAALPDRAHAGTALAAAERAVAHATACQALWTTAYDAFTTAEAAFAANSFEASIGASRRAVELSRLGIVQRRAARDGGGECPAPDRNTHGDTP